MQAYRWCIASVIHFTGGAALRPYNIYNKSVEYPIILEKILSQCDLTATEMHEVMQSIMQGELSAAQIGAFLAAMRSKGVSAGELSAAVKVLRALSTKIPLSASATPHLIDTCGTGGDGKQTFNISTAVAFVAAAGGAKVAKHGNKSVSSSSGSADLLKQAGANLELSPKAIAKSIEDIGFGFIFAPLHHQAMKYVAPIRQELKVRTIFNMLGPLTNPAGCKRQVIGVFAKEMLPLYAAALQELGAEHALIVHSVDGMDEISPAASTYCIELKGKDISEYQIEAKDFGLNNHPLSSISCDSATTSLAMVKAALVNEHAAAATTVALNAGAALYIAGISASIKTGVATAQEIIASGAALKLLDDYVKWSQSA